MDEVEVADVDADAVKTAKWRGDGDTKYRRRDGDDEVQFAGGKTFLKRERTNKRKRVKCRAHRKNDMPILVKKSVHACI